MLLPLLTRVLPTFPLSEKVRKAGFLILLDMSMMGKHLKIQIPGLNSWRSPISTSGVGNLYLFLKAPMKIGMPPGLSNTAGNQPVTSVPQFQFLRKDINYLLLALLKYVYASKVLGQQLKRSLPTQTQEEGYLGQLTRGKAAPSKQAAHHVMSFYNER